MLHISNIDTLQSVCFAYFHSLMKHGIIFWGNSSDSRKVFLLQKKIVRLVMGIKSRNSYRDLFKRLEIITLPCEYIFSLINFVTDNECFQTNADVHRVNTKHKHYLPKPTVNISCFQKSTHYAGIKVFNNLPSDLRSLINKKAQFKIALKQYSNTRSFYSIDEYFLSKK
jgi:hypothetical protein